MRRRTEGRNELARDAVAWYAFIYYNRFIKATNFRPKEKWSMKPHLDPKFIFYLATTWDVVLDIYI